MAKKKLENPPEWRNDTVLPLPLEVKANAWAVDAGCSGNPGPMEYQAIDLATGEKVFHYGPLHGTNNIGEFLAIVHALALMEQRGITDKVIYSDSVNAMLWVSKKQCQTGAHATDRRALRHYRQGRSMVAHPRRQDSHPEMGNQAVGRDTRRLRQEMTYWT